MEEVGLGLTGMAWNKGIWFFPDWNGLEWRKSILAGRDWLGMEEVSFGLTGMRSGIESLKRNRKNSHQQGIQRFD
jgi:hypothetical protein